MQSESTNCRRQTNWLVVAVVVIGAALASLPVVFHLAAPPGPRLGAIFAYLPVTLAAVLCYALDRKLSKKEKVDVLLLSIALALATTYLHVWMVDQNQVFHDSTNIDWQLRLQESVIGLRPDALPHSYRFLPNSIVRLFEQVTGDFSIARDGYRNLFSLLLFYTFYRFSRLWLRHGASLFCLALLAVILPISFRNYAGQLTDPMSHLSFVLAFLFIETEQFAYLLLTVTIGCLAKEAIVAMAGYYALFRWREQSYFTKLAVLILAPVAVCGFVRVLVLKQFPGYEQVSGVDSNHSSLNWILFSEWFPALLYTAGIFVPFVVAGWRKSPWTLRSLTIFWFPVLFFSGLYFSWLRESRNFVPLSALLIVMTVYYLVPVERNQAESETAPVGRLGSRHGSRKKIRRS